jgi:peptide/nickel transport system ATP-binding protein
MEYKQYEIKPAQKENNNDIFLKVENLQTRFFTSKGIVKALDSLSLSVKRGEIFGLVGESGCGKSVTATSIMDLIPDPPGRITAGHIYVNGFDILGDLDELAKIKVKSETDVRIKRYKKKIKRHNFIINSIRGQEIAMIFQEPFLALNPLLTISEQITETILLHDTVRIGEAIIKRESVSEKDVDDFISEILSLSDKQVRDKRINQWCSEFGISDSETDIIQIFDSDSNLGQIRNNILQIFRVQIRSIDLEPIRQVVEYEKIKEELLDLTLQFLQTKYDGKSDEELESRLHEKERQFNSLGRSLSIKRKISKAKYRKPFELEARKRALELLRLVNIAGPERVLDSYPHELSGGMQQRAMIAMALSSNPSLLIADEPTTALDVTTQAQILKLIRELKEFLGSSVIFITHDLAVIAEMCDRLGVMYAGNLIEESTTNTIFENPKHPYTIGLLKSIPRVDQKIGKDFLLESIPGNVPNLIKPPPGCRFNPRCSFKMDICEKKKPKLVEIEKGHKVACFLYSEETED